MSKKPRITKGMSVGYANAKKALFEQESPQAKMERLRNAEKKLWEAYRKAEKEASDYYLVYEDEVNAYIEKAKALQKLAVSFDDEMDNFNIIDEILPPRKFNYDE